jgi:glycosyltransferase involved in cell wall biosynthesis
MSATSDLVCLTHLRWDFVFQRPQHLMTRFAQHRRVYYFEEPVWIKDQKPYLELRQRENGLKIAVPHLPEGKDTPTIIRMITTLLDEMIAGEKINDYTMWYCTPMAMLVSRHLEPQKIIYDCFDELSHFLGAPPEMLELERELLARADLVFTGGRSLYEHKRSQHHNIHCFPSSVDLQHFSAARKIREKLETEAAQTNQKRNPRVGFYGVIDERFDIKLLREAAALRPNWDFVMLGPVVKIDPATLPQAKNIQYPGMKTYNELPLHLAGWDVALLPFALNDSTKFISPTKTPEYLAAGCPVVSTPISDVVRPYGEMGLVHIASNAQEFVAACEKAMTERLAPGRQNRVDEFLSLTSWNQTWSKIADLELSISRSADRKTVVSKIS